VNPKPKSYIIKQMQKRGFDYWEKQTADFANVSANKLEGIGYNWWSDNMMIFKKRRFASVHPDYFIQGISTDNSSHKENFLRRGLINTSLQNEFLKLTSIIRSVVSNKEAFSILRLGDGDYYFLRRIARGSAAPGRRALTVSYDKINMELYRKLFWQNDLIAASLEKHDWKNWRIFITLELVEKIYLKLFKTLPPFDRYPKIAYGIDLILKPLMFGGFLAKCSAKLFSLWRKDTYYKKASAIIDNTGIPFETVYALITTKWIFRNYKNQIAIIAGENKLNVIKELMKRKEYQEYLGIDSFVSYISVPEKGAADNLDLVAKTVGEQVKASSAKVFLIGAGSAKLGLIPLLKGYNDVLFIDVGAGVDAIAGIVCPDRPYFAEWTNYRIRGYDYSKIDFMDKDNPAWNNREYKTVEID
jgi:hypothetical protein